MLLLAAISPVRLTKRLPKVVFHALLGRDEVSKFAVADKYDEPDATFRVGTDAESMTVVETPFL